MVSLSVILEVISRCLVDDDHSELLAVSVVYQSFACTHGRRPCWRKACRNARLGHPCVEAPLQRMGEHVILSCTFRFRRVPRYLRRSSMQQGCKTPRCLFFFPIRIKIECISAQCCGMNSGGRHVAINNNGERRPGVCHSKASLLSYPGQRAAV